LFVVEWFFGKSLKDVDDFIAQIAFEISFFVILFFQNSKYYFIGNLVIIPLNPFDSAAKL